jgi:hypothetical protein
MVCFTLSDCLADLTAGRLDGVPALERAAMQLAFEFLKMLEDRIAGSRPLVMISLQSAAREAEMSAAEYRAWLAEYLTRYSIRDVLEHRAQVAGQPIVVMDEKDLAHPELYSVLRRGELPLLAPAWN